MAVPPKSRRLFLKGALAASVSLAAITGYVPRALANRKNLRVTFTHGVASGDPLQDRVILWTRATADAPGDLPLFWLISENPDMSAPVAGGVVVARAERDWCVKVDAAGLRPGVTHYYRFYYRDQASPQGVTKTLPTGDVRQAKLAVFSCANYPKGFFHVYAEAARRTDLDGVVHLGDYIYEYGPDGYRTPALNLGLVPQPRIAQLNPLREIVSLQDYRLRYALYRSDPGLQELHRKLPWFIVWDDHESTNDSWRNGAENHQPDTEGDWQARLRAAAQAWHEWMPVRTRANDELTIYRSFDYGNLARLVMLDTRIEGRDRYAVTPDQFVGLYATARADGTFPLDVNPDGSTRRMMSATQEAWLVDQLRTSSQTWQIIGNQTLIHYQAAPDIQNSRILNDVQRQQIIAGLTQLFGPAGAQGVLQLGANGLPLFDAFADSWAAYPTARFRMLGYLAQLARNPVVITGDSHNGWAANLRVPFGGGLANVGVEFATPSVTSPGYEEQLVGFPPALISALILENNQNRLDQLVYAELQSRGFMVLDITPERVRSDWVMVDSVFTPTYTARTDRSLQVRASDRRITPVG